MKKRAYIKYFTLIVLIGTILLTQTSVAAFKNVAVGDRAPNIILRDTSGAEHTLESLYGDSELVILLFWATWSPRSIKELKDVQAFYDTYKEKGFNIYAVNVENEDISQEDIVNIKKVIEENNIKFKVVLDEGLAAFRNYGVVAIPSSAIITKVGDVVKDYASYATFAKQDIKDNIEYELGIKERPKDVEAADVVKRYKPVKAATLHYGLGKKLIDRGMADKAIREFTKSAELDAKFDKPLAGLGEVYYNKSLKQKKKARKAEYLNNAKEAYLKAIQISPDSLPSLSGLALVLIEEKKDVEAEKHLAKVLKLEPNFTPALSAMGVLFKNKGEVEKAIEKFDTALELNPNQPEIHYLKAMTYNKAGDEKKAIASLKKSFKYLLKQVSLAMVQEGKEK